MRNGFRAVTRFFCTMAALPGLPAAMSMAAYWMVASSLSLPSLLARKALRT